MNKLSMFTLALGLIFGITAAILSYYGDFVGANMMAGAGIGLFIGYFLRRKMKKDEMTKRISNVASEYSLIAAIITIGILTIALHFDPGLFDVFEVLAILIAVIILSKIACHFYYTKIKKEIGF